MGLTRQLVELRIYNDRWMSEEVTRNILHQQRRYVQNLMTTELAGCKFREF